MVGRLVSFWGGLISGAMLVSGRVPTMNPFEKGGMTICICIFLKASTIVEQDMGPIDQRKESVLHFW